MMPLFEYECSVLATLYVLADDKNAAQKIARDSVDDAIEDEIFSSDQRPDFIREIGPGDKVPKQWLNETPYGGDNRTIAQILAEVPESEPVPITKVELEALGQLPIFGTTEE